MDAFDGAMKELAIEIFKFNVNFANVEVRLYQLLSVLLVDDGQIAEVILNASDSISKKLEIVVKIARTKSQHPASQFVLKLKDPFEKAIRL